MANISDIIEDFILSTMGKDNTLDFSRNDLANHFACVPSQINYVLTTRFNPSRGFIVESQRGGGGYIRIIKLNFSKDENDISNLLELVKEQMNYKEAIDILTLLENMNFLKEEETEKYSVLFSDKSLANPFKLQPYLRANMLKELIYNLIKEKA